MRGRRQARVIDDVLEAVRHAVEWATQGATLNLRLGAARVFQRELGGEAEESIEIPVVLLDAVDQRLGVLNGRELPRAQQFGGLGNGEPGEVGNRSPSAPRRNTCAGSSAGVIFPTGSASRRARAVFVARSSCCKCSSVKRVMPISAAFLRTSSSVKLSSAMVVCPPQVLRNRVAPLR